MKIPPAGPTRAARTAFLRSKLSRSGSISSVASTEPPVPFHAFIAYADVSAASRAMSTINEVLHAIQRKHTLTPMLWRFSQLLDPKWHDSAITDATQANVVVLASTSAATLTPELESWVGSLIARKRGARTTLVALFGAEEAWTISIEAPQTVVAVNSAHTASRQRLVA